VTGNTVVVLATSDVPGGVINVLTGRTAEVAPWLASHMDVNAIDLTGAPAALSEELAVAAAENLKRVLRGVAKDGRDEDWTQSPASTVCRPTSKPRPSGTLPAPDPSPHSTWWTSGLTSCRLGCVSDLSRQGACSGVGW
jgi:hypothetical protein